MAETETKPRRKWIVILVVGCAAYFGTYYLMVQKSDLTNWESSMKILFSESPFAAKDGPLPGPLNPSVEMPDTWNHLPRYRLGGGWTARLYHPMHLIDRVVRPSHWQAKECRDKLEPSDWPESMKSRP